MPKKPKDTPLSEQLRKIIEAVPISRYRIAKEAKVDASQIHRFLNGKGKLTTDSLDRIGQVLKLHLTSELKQSNEETKE